MNKYAEIYIESFNKEASRLGMLKGLVGSGIKNVKEFAGGYGEGLGTTFKAMIRGASEPGIPMRSRVENFFLNMIAPVIPRSYYPTSRANLAGNTMGLLTPSVGLAAVGLDAASGVYEKGKQRIREYKDSKK